MNSTTMKRIWIERKAPGKAQDRKNGKRKEPYDVPTTTEWQRKRPKKEPEKKHPTKNAVPPSENHQKQQLSGQRHKTKLKKHPQQMNEQNLVLTETEPPRRGPRARQGCDTEKWCFCKAGRFSYGESPRTPPLEGNSLHRWTNSVERPWGILSLFTTCLPVIQSPCHRLWHMSPTLGKAVRRNEPYKMWKRTKPLIPRYKKV